MLLAFECPVSPHCIYLFVLCVGESKAPPVLYSTVYVGARAMLTACT